MEHDLLIRHHDKLLQLSQELTSAGEALATRMTGDEAAIPAPTAHELLTNLMETLMTMSRTTQGLRVRLVASLYRTGIRLAHVDLVTGETREPEEPVLAAAANILSSGTSLELAERSLSRARNAIAAQVHKHHAGTYGLRTLGPPQPALNHGTFPADTRQRVGPETPFKL